LEVRGGKLTRSRELFLGGWTFLGREGSQSAKCQSDKDFVHVLPHPGLKNEGKKKKEFGENFSNDLKSGPASHAEHSELLGALV